MKEKKTDLKKVAFVFESSPIHRPIKLLIETFGNYEISEFQYEENDDNDRSGEFDSFDAILFLNESQFALKFCKFMTKSSVHHEDVPVLVIDAMNDSTNLKIFFQVGACGYLKIDEDCKLLKEALDEIIDKKIYVNSHMVNCLRGGIEIINTTSDFLVTIQKLSVREIQFLKLLCNVNEYMYSEIAEMMNISIKAVDKCRHKLFQKFKVKSKTGLVIMVYNNRLESFIE